MGRVSLGLFSSRPVRRGFDTLEALLDALREDIANPDTTQAGNGTSSELFLTSDALIPLLQPSIGPYSAGGELDLPAQYRTRLQSPDTNENGVAKTRHPLATVYEIANIADVTTRSIVQRAASRGIETAIEAIDGYHYSFNNAWTSKDQDGLRFSYICQDSMQNKDRHANGHARALRQAGQHARVEGRKPTYDCKGSISVKCSLNQGCVEVHYRHLAIHPTVAERKSMPPKPGRPRKKDVEYGRHAEANHGGLSSALQDELTAFAAVPSGQVAIQSRPPPASNAGRPLKRKRGEEVPTPTPTSGRELSLAELLRRSEGAKARSPVQTTRPNKLNAPLTGVQYDLPSWETPPPPLIKPPQHSGTTLWPQPYTPPPHWTQRKNKKQQASTNGAPNQSTSTPANQPYPTQPQGLFTTLKPVPQPATPTQPWQASAPAQHYIPPGQQIPAWIGAAVGGLGGQSQAGRAPSPDPWFPKR